MEPPRGHVPMLKKYKEDNPSVNCAISTFGFGYNLDSKLLNELALEGRGSFAFIPDGQFVGTVFVNALSNLMSTLAVDSVLCLETANGSSFPEEHAVLGDLDHIRVSWGLSVSLGSLQFGQSKDIIVRMNKIDASAKDSTYLIATLKYKTSSSAKVVQEISAQGNNHA